MIERNLAKVEVAGLSPVSRSDLAKWQSGNAAACKAVNAGSIPTLASLHCVYDTYNLIKAHDYSIFNTHRRFDTTCIWIFILIFFYQSRSNE